MIILPFFIFLASVQSKIDRFSKLPLLVSSKQKTLGNRRGLSTELENEVKLLKKELSYYQNSIYEISQKTAKKAQKTSVSCRDISGIAKCQVSCNFYTFSFE